MPIDVLMVRVGGRLAPADPISAEAISSITAQEMVRAHITRPRNSKHHRLAFALLNTVFTAQSNYPTMEHLLDAIKIASGHFDEYKLSDGRVVIKPRSISFAAMDQASFSQWYERMLDIVLTKILPNTKRADLENRVYEILGEPTPDQYARH